MALTTTLRTSWQSLRERRMSDFITSAGYNIAQADDELEAGNKKKAIDNIISAVDSLKDAVEALEKKIGGPGLYNLDTGFPPPQPAVGSVIVVKRDMTLWVFTHTNFTTLNTQPGYSMGGKDEYTWLHVWEFAGQNDSNMYVIDHSSFE
jgi:hypothetical protein